jgi:hypothetical protein
MAEPIQDEVVVDAEATIPAKEGGFAGNGSVASRRTSTRASFEISRDLLQRH